ncbi:hypothetical protein MCN98_07870 [Flavobacteriaceae bacterium LSUCC0859]|nr:hypothetical protein [Flavobacteriaceae bacterium LSUCC0859]
MFHIINKKISIFDANESIYLKRECTYNKNSKNKVLVQCPHDYFFLVFITKFIKNNRDLTFVGVYPEAFSPKLVYFFFPPLYFLKKVIFSLRKKKWLRLYKSAGVDFYLPKKNSITTTYKIFLDSLKVFFCLKSKKDLLNVKYKEIYCGDLIYDSYLRFNNKHTLNFKDFVLLIYIFRAFLDIHFFKQLNTHYFKYLSTYSSYIKHGIPVRVLIKKQTEVFTYCSHRIIFKRLSSKDYFHLPNFSNFHQDFKNLNLSKDELLKTENKIKDLFNGNFKYSYLESSPFVEYDSDLKSLNLDGIVFLHEFYDSPHSYRYMIYEDLYEWAVNILKTLRNYNYKVAVKPHPNNKNSKLLKDLQCEFFDFIWLDKSYSNLSIFDSGIKFGISNHGNVLFELAYNNIIPISTGENPYISYDFILKANNVKALNELLLNILNYKYNCKKHQLISAFYMNNIFTKDDLDSGIEVNESEIRDLYNSNNLLDV